MWLNADEVGRGIDHYKKSFGEFPTGENKDIIKKLSGENPRHVVLIQNVSESINLQGEIVDMWRIPLKVQFEGTNSFTIKSAGQDKKFEDDDDITTLSSSTNYLQKP